MSDGPNRWEVAAPLPLYSWGRQWNVRADPIERTPHDPMRSTSTAPIDSEEPINNSSIAAASRSESEASGPSKASGPLEFDFISSEAPIDTFEIDAANSLISEISGSSRPNGLKLRPGQSLADRSSTAMEQLQVTAAQAADCRRAELGNGPGTLDGAEADTAQEISERLKTLEPNLSRSHRYPAKFWPMLGLSVGTAGSVCLVLLMHLGETKPVVIATADPGTRSTPTAEDASLDQQLLDKSLSAQRILAERKAPASQTGKVSVDEPVGSSPAAMDPASARSVAGTPMAPPAGSDKRDPKRRCGWICGTVSSGERPFPNEFRGRRSSGVAVGGYQH